MGKRSAGKPLSYSTNGDFARRSREQRGLSQAKFAEKCRLSERTIRDIESGLGASPAAIQFVASQLNLPNWHDLLTDRERTRFPGSSTPTPVPVSPTAPVRPIVNRLFQLPSVVADFTGREDEFRRMVERLHGGGGKVGVSVLCGMGGVGKTSLAVKVAHEVKNCFPDARLFLDLRGMSDQPVTAVEAMSRVIRDFHPETGKLADTETELLPHFRSVLSGKKALIVLDNAKDESQVKPLLSADSSVAFLITSRNTLMLDGVEGLRLDVLSSDDAFVLLREIVGAKGTDAELRMVVELCGGLPLALRVAGDFLRLHDNWTVVRYTEALRDEANRLKTLRSKKPAKEPEPWENLDTRANDKLEVEAVLALSARELIRENPERAARWQMLSVFPADFDALAAASVWELDDDTTLDELTVFLDRSLLQYEVDADRYELHDLMRPVARDVFDYAENRPLHASTEERFRTAELQFARYYCYVLAHATKSYHRGHNDLIIGLNLFDQEAENIRCGRRWAFDNRSTDSLALMMCRDYPLGGGAIISHRLSIHDLIDWLEAALDACKVLTDRRGEQAALVNLGVAYNKRGDTRTALAYYGKADEIAREIWGSDGEVTLQGNIGNAHRSLGDAHAAIALHEKTLSNARNVADRRGEGVALGNLADDHYAIGDVRAAIALCEQSLVIAREFGDLFDEVRYLNFLGRVHRDRGDALAAIVLHEQAVVIAKKVTDRHGEGVALGNLGNAYTAAGDARTAIAFHEQALAIAREVGDRQGEAATLGGLGNAHSYLKEARTAITFYEQQWAIARNIGQKSYEMTSLWNLAVSFDSLLLRADAIQYATHALAICEAIESPHAEVIRRQLAAWGGESSHFGFYLPSVSHAITFYSHAEVVSGLALSPQTFVSCDTSRS